MEGQDIWKRVARKIGGKLSREFTYVVLAVMNYHICKGMTEVLWQSIVPRPQSVCNQIKEDKVRVTELLREWKRDKDRR